MNTALESDKTRYLVVDKQGILTAPPQSEVAAVDQMDRSAAEAFAKRMAEYREANPGESVVDTETLASHGRDLTLSELLEIPDLETFDPRPGWEQRRWDTRMQIPLGTLYRDGSPTGTAFIKDLGSANNPGGEGVHGCYQGQSGSGKSVYLEDEVISTCAWHPPDKVNFMLIDFKGEASFVGFEKLPHVRGVVRDTGDPEILDRLASTIKGEVDRRKRILGEAQTLLGTNIPDVGKYLEFRAMSRDECAAAGFPFYIREVLKPLPVLIILIDEASIFHKNWKHDFSKVFEYIVKQGRSVGVWIKFASQELAFLHGEAVLWAEMNYKSSLVVNNENLSRVVLGGTGQEAYDAHVKKRVSNYVKGGHIFFNFAGDDIVHLRAANNMLEYKKAGVTSTGPSQETALEMTPFTLANSWQIEAEAGQPVSQPELNSEKSTDGKIRTERSELSMLLKRLSIPVETDLHDMWTPPLRKTVTLHQLDSFGGLRPAESLNDLILPVGIIDHPTDAVQSLMSVDFMRVGSVVIGGTGKSGRSTALNTMVVSSALRFSPKHLSWLLVDQGGDLGVVRKLPNIAGYARRGNNAMRDRIFAEIQRVIILRERLFGAKGLNSTTEYLNWRESNPVSADPYGYIFVGIDGWISLQAQLKDEDMAGVASGWVGALGRMIESGPTLGVHFVVTTDSSAQDLPSVAQKAVSPIYLRGAEHMTDAGSVAKQIIKNYPINQPGLTLATSTLNGQEKDKVLRGRVAVPIRGDIPEPGPEEIERMTPQNYGEEIIKLCEDIAAAVPVDQHIPMLAPLPMQLSFADMWSSWRKAENRKPELPGRQQRNIDLPLGISSVDMGIAGIPWSVDTQSASAHTLCLGRPQSGRTSLLRTEIAAIVGSFAPHEAKVILIDERGALNRERRFLAQEHYLAGHGDREDTERVLRAVLDEVKRRIGTNPDLDEQIEEEQTFFEGPSLFVLVDNVEVYRAGQGSSPQAAQLLAEIIRVRQRVGVHVIATATHDGFSNENPRPASVSPIAALEEVRAHIISLDATSRMKVRGELRADAFPVPGRGYLISDFVPLSANGKPPIIQIAHLTGLRRRKMD